MSGIRTVFSNRFGLIYLLLIGQITTFYPFQTVLQPVFAQNTGTDKINGSIVLADEDADLYSVPLPTDTTRRPALPTAQSVRESKQATRAASQRESNTAIQPISPSAQPRAGIANPASGVQKGEKSSGRTAVQRKPQSTPATDPLEGTSHLASQSSATVTPVSSSAPAGIAPPMSYEKATGRKEMPKKDEPLVSVQPVAASVGIRTVSPEAAYQGTNRQKVTAPQTTGAQTHATADAVVPSENPPRSDGLQVGMFQRGQASYYGEKFQGRRTASGERFDMNAMTAAHKTLPFGTLISVTNLRNGKSIKVRINDRGPYIAGRIIDVSKKGAEDLGMMESGVTLAEIVVLSLPDERKTVTQNPVKQLGTPISSRSGDDSISDHRRFAIQIASYSKLKYAYRQLEHLKAAGIPIHIEQHGKYHRLIVVNLNKEQVAYYRKQLASLGLTQVLVRQE